MADPTVSHTYESNRQPDPKADYLKFSVVFPDTEAPASADEPEYELQYRLSVLVVVKPKVTQVTKKVFKHKNPELTWTSCPGDGDLIYSAGAMFRQSYFTGEIALIVKYKPSGSSAAKQFEYVCNAGNAVNKPQSIALSVGAPELGKAILTAEAPAIPIDPSWTSPESEVVSSVHARLKRGLSDVWLTMPSLPGVPVTTASGSTEERPLRDIDPSELTSTEDLEECWAQWVSECQVGTPYAGPGGTYLGGSAVEDQKVLALAAQSTNPAYPIVFACQHLGTFAAITRGLDDAAKYQLDARDASNMTNWKTGAKGGTSGFLKDGAANAAASDAIDNGLLWPGDAYVRTRSANHVAYVLRVLKSKQFQFLDTGGMAIQSATPSRPPFLAKAVGGMNFDTPEASRITCGLEHLGVVPQPAKLREAIRRLAQSRPLGLARLVLLKRLSAGDNVTDSDNTGDPERISQRLLYASPLVPLWETDPGLNYPIARLMWSLRNHGRCKEIEARWLVDVPSHALYREMASASRTYVPSMDTPRTPLIDLASCRDGGVRVVGHYWYGVGDKGQSQGYWRDGATETNWLLTGAANASWKPPAEPCPRRCGMADFEPGAGSSKVHLGAWLPNGATRPLGTFPAYLPLPPI